MTVQKKLKPGDLVKMNDRYRVSDRYRGVVFTVTSDPWPCGGAEIILLDGYRGGYATDGLDLVEEVSA